MTRPALQCQFPSCRWLPDKTALTLQDIHIAELRLQVIAWRLVHRQINHIFLRGPGFHPQYSSIAACWAPMSKAVPICPDNSAYWYMRRAALIAEALSISSACPADPMSVAISAAVMGISVDSTRCVVRRLSRFLGQEMALYGRSPSAPRNHRPP